MSIYKSRQNDIHIPYFNINNLITFEGLNAIKKTYTAQPIKYKAKQQKETIKEKNQQKTYANAKTCTYTYKIMNDHMQKNAHTNAKKCIEPCKKMHMYMQNNAYAHAKKCICTCK